MCGFVQGFGVEGFVKLDEILLALARVGSVGQARAEAVDYAVDD